MAARVVLPAVKPIWTGYAPLDLEGELRKAAQKACGNKLDHDLLELISCLACEAAAGDTSDAGFPVRFWTTIRPALCETSLDEVAREEVVNAMLSVIVSGEGQGEGADITFKPLMEDAKSLRKPGGKQWANRGTMANLREAEYLHEHTARLVEQQSDRAGRESELAAYYGRRAEKEVAPPEPIVPTTVTIGPVVEDDASSSDDEISRKDREQTKQRLRELGQPATFFGEGDLGRTARLHRLELVGDQDVLAQGSTNVLQMVDRRADKGLNLDDEDDLMARAELSHTASGVAQPIGGTSVAPLAISASAEPDEVEKESDAVDDVSRSVLLWLRSTLREWEAMLVSRAPLEQEKTAFKAERGQFRQSKQYLRPLRRALRDGTLSPEIATSLGNIATFSKEKRYREAKEAYMQLAIGNNPWPIGVTQVTFHDRPNRHSIGEGQIAHILDDETTRKYFQTIKRLLSLCETRWPIDPSLAA